ncbi:hypothetical protein WN48_00405 [Eufriesea mexicana]|nr:hypothetical protein WN48_00405 [Eufriesea mexicana]
MSQTPPKNAKPTGSRPSRGSRRTPRGSRLQARVNFFEEMFESLESSTTSGDSSFEESFERMVEEESEGSSRTPSEEHALEDSDYQSRSHGAPNHGSKSSSIASFARLPSDESLSHRRGSGSPQQHLVLDDRTPSEWYAEYCTQRFQNIGSRIEFMRSKSEYDAHIAEIKEVIYSAVRGLRTNESLIVDEKKYDKRDWKLNIEIDPEKEATQISEDEVEL